MSSRFRLIMFDMDGTFIDSLEFHTEVFYQFLNRYVTPVSSIDLVRPYMGTNVRDIFEGFQVPEERYPKLFEQLDIFLRTQVDGLIQEIGIAPDIWETLDFVRECGVLTAVVSNSMQAVVERILQLHSLDQRFDYVCGAELRAFNKNDRCERVRLAADVDRHETLYVGDSLNDIILAKEMGYASCFADTVLNWCEDRDYMFDVLKPDYTVKTLSEIKNIYS